MVIGIINAIYNVIKLSTYIHSIFIFNNINIKIELLNKIIIHHGLDFN
jgi:hypothetical protein